MNELKHYEQLVTPLGIQGVGLKKLSKFLSGEMEIIKRYFVSGLSLARSSKEL